MISLGELLIVVFAAYRGTRIVVHDDIAAPARDVVFRWHARRTSSRLRRAAVTLVTCPFCMGVWVSGALLALWQSALGEWGGTGSAGWAGVLFVVDTLAVAGGQSLLNRWDDAHDNEAGVGA